MKVDAMVADAKAVRTMTLKFKITPTDDRTRATVTFQAESKIAADAACVDQMYFGKGGCFVSNAEQLEIPNYETDVTDIDGKKEGSNDDN